MKPREFYKHASDLVAPNPLQDQRSRERIRLDEQESVLRARAANMVEKIFSELEPHSENMSLNKDGLKRSQRFRGIPIREGVVVSGESRVSSVQSRTIHHPSIIREHNRQAVILELAPGQEFDNLVPAGFSTELRITVGIDNARTSFDGGITFEELNLAENIEVITGLSIKPEDANANEKLDKGLVVDPFQFRLVLIERFNETGPIFTGDDYRHLGYSVSPTEKHYDYAEALIAGIHASLDYLDEVLEPTADE